MGPNDNNSPNDTSQSSAPRLGGNKSGVMNMKNGSNKKMLAAVALLVVLALVIGGVIAWKQMGSSSGVKGNQYQALFLTNGQVYFGKLSNVNERYVKLNDIYYLQVQQAVQPAEGNSQQQPKVSLAKLGSELHGPEDEMLVNRDQVLFWENLKDDGKVAKAIQDNKK
jgi:hypothetical protein